MATLVALRNLVTILVSVLTNPENLNSDLTLIPIPKFEVNKHMSPLLRRTTQHLWNFSRLSSTPCVIRPGSTSGAFGPSMDQSHLHPAQRMDHSSSRGRTLTISESPRASARTCQPHPRTVAHVNEVDGCRDRMVRSFRASANSSVTSFSSPALTSAAEYCGDGVGLKEGCGGRG